MPNRQPTQTVPQPDTLPSDRPRVSGGVRRGTAVTVATTLVAALLGWIYLVFVVLAVPEPLRANLGPGMNLTTLGGAPDVPAFLAALCVPATLTTGVDWTALAVTFAMWVAMVFAMMLPTAIPMFATYSRILADTAQTGQRRPSRTLLAAGYTSVWVGFALVATLAQTGLVWLGTLSPAMTPLAPALAGMTLIAAGLYQFTPAKYACLVRCRAPYSVLYARWRSTGFGMLRLGVEEGLFCLGCCWTLMLVMFAVGVMNVVWMALFAALMVAEKMGTGRKLTVGIGIGLVVWGVLLVAVSEPGRRLIGMLQL
ncbi:DUF2182 domain-containing protein [Amorphus coralli]|uniref:DUF2182 domain-containing protein n=1 Tax=Amorphus coralli TaxID=340680 RepID=UPI00036DBD43|nr:DUF2182 domain-containing protein [Amorphus coralli]